MLANHIFGSLYSHYHLLLHWLAKRPGKIKKKKKIRIVKLLLLKPKPFFLKHKKKKEGIFVIVILVCHYVHFIWILIEISYR